MVARPSLAQSIAKELAAAIYVGEFRAGQRLPPERALMERYSAGRNTIREAVQSLVAQGLLDVSPGRGTTVLEVSQGTPFEHADFSVLTGNAAVDDLYEFRILLEVDATAKAAARARGDDIVEIMEALRRHEQAVPDGPPGVTRRGTEFHAAIVKASHNTAYIAALKAMAGPLTAVREHIDAVPGAISSGAADHRRIAELIAHGDVEGASAAMLLHLRTAQTNLAKARALEEAGPRPAPADLQSDPEPDPDTRTTGETGALATC
jgi:DNA-binding FadR family transcriptional regulator